MTEERRPAGVGDVVQFAPDATDHTLVGCFAGVAEIWMPGDDDVLVRTVTLPLGEYRRVGSAVPSGGDMRATIRALILANEFLEHELQTKVSQGYTRGVRHGRFGTYSG